MSVDTYGDAKFIGGLRTERDLSRVGIRGKQRFY